MATEETERRKRLPGEFVRCPRCYGYHGQLLNVDALCETCEQLTAPFRYDASRQAAPKQNRAMKNTEQNCGPETGRNSRA